MDLPRPTSDTWTQRLVLVTGPSGAGRSTAINALEDLGYEVIDNLPLTLIPRLLEGDPRAAPLALGLDVRNRDFSAHRLIELVDNLTLDPRFRVDLVYLDCSDEVLLRRYSETRRRHPLADGQAPRAAIAAEIDLLIPVRARADTLYDTSEMSPHDLKAEIAAVFGTGDTQRLGVSLHSFSYKRGVPRGIDLMFDVRFLSNPHWNPDLRDLTGQNPAVQAHVMADARFDPYFAKVLDLLLFTLPAHLQEGKSHLAIGFGCSGGKHRSVTMVEKMAPALADVGWTVSKRHRELERKSDVVRIALQDSQGRPDDG